MLKTLQCSCLLKDNNMSPNKTCSILHTVIQLNSQLHKNVLQFNRGSISSEMSMSDRHQLSRRYFPKSVRVIDGDIQYIPCCVFRLCSYITRASVETQRPLSVEWTQGPELQWHSVWTGMGRVLVGQSVIVMVLHWFPLWILRERPETVQVDLLTEASGHGVHQ